MLDKLFPDIEFDESVGVEADFSNLLDCFHEQEKIKSWNSNVKSWIVDKAGNTGSSKWTWLVVNTLCFHVKYNNNSENGKNDITLNLDKGPFWLKRLDLIFSLEQKVGYISLSLHGKIGTSPFFIKRWMAAIMRRQLSQSLEELKNKVEKHQTLA